MDNETNGILEEVARVQGVIDSMEREKQETNKIEFSPAKDGVDGALEKLHVYFSQLEKIAKNAPPPTEQEKKVWAKDEAREEHITTVLSEHLANHRETGLPSNYRKSCRIYTLFPIKQCVSTFVANCSEGCLFDWLSEDPDGNRPDEFYDIVNELSQYDDGSYLV